MAPAETPTAIDTPITGLPPARGPGGPVASTAPARGRRVARVSGEERETAILATAERLLDEQRPVQEISVDDLARGAGISRPTFYFYFPSKEAVFLTLVERLVEQADTSKGDILERLAEDPPRRWREVLDVFFSTFDGHRPVVVACAHIRTVSAEARDLWSEVLKSWISAAAEAIEAERARGAAPPGVDPHQLATALVSMNERVQFATFAEESPAIPETDVQDVLLSVWLGAIYGNPSGPVS